MRLSSSGNFQPFAVLPLVVALVALILSFLLVFAGHKPGFMEDYAVFTLNSSRIGENMVASFDNKISGLNLSSILDITKRDIPYPDARIPQVTPAPVVTFGSPSDRGEVRRGMGDDILSGLSDAASAVGGEATAIASAAESKASAVEGAVTSGINNAMAKAESAIIDAVNNAYEDLIEALKLKDFYSIHMLTTYEGGYACSKTAVTMRVRQSLYVGSSDSSYHR